MLLRRIVRQLLRKDGCLWNTDCHVKLHEIRKPGKQPPAINSGKNLPRPGSGKTHAGMTNESIAQRFSRLADLLEIKGDDTYRIRSYRNAALTIEGWPTPLEEIAADEGLKGLQTIPGVGKAISSKIIQLLQTGTFEAWERTTQEVPPSVLDLLRVSGIGIQTAATLFQKFKVSSIYDLKLFAEGGGLDLVDGIGEKTASRILDEVRRL
jgi:DNA polymerase (family X)